MRKQKIFSVLIGEQARGKSMMMLKSTILYKGRVLVYGDPDEDTFEWMGEAVEDLNELRKMGKNEKRRVWEGLVDYNDFWAFVLKYVRNCQVIIPDATGHENMRLSPNIRKVLYKLRHYGLDVTMAFHNSQRIPKEILECAHYIVKFKEGLSFPVERFQHLQPETIEKCLAAWELVENYESNNPNNPDARYFSVTIPMKKLLN